MIHSSKLLLLACCLFSLMSCTTRDHDTAKNKFKEAGMIEINDQGYKLYSFSNTYVSTSTIYGTVFFIYSEMIDIFRLGCTFGSHDSSTQDTEGFVYADFKWGKYKSAINYFDLITYSSSSEYLHCAIEYSNPTINGSELVDIETTITYAATANIKADSGLDLVKQAFRYGVLIMNRYNLPKFY